MEDIKIKVSCKNLDGSVDTSKVTMDSNNDVTYETTEGESPFAKVAEENDFKEVNEFEKGIITPIIKDGNSEYGVSVPNTTSWTGNKTIATLDDIKEGLTIIEKNDLAVPFTEEEVNLLKDYKAVVRYNNNIYSFNHESIGGSVEYIELYSLSDDYNLEQFFVHKLAIDLDTYTGSMETTMVLKIEQNYSNAFFVEEGADVPAGSLLCSVDEMVQGGASYNIVKFETHKNYTSTLFLTLLSLAVNSTLNLGILVSDTNQDELSINHIASFYGLLPMISIEFHVSDLINVITPIFAQIIATYDMNSLTVLFKIFEFNLLNPQTNDVQKYELYINGTTGSDANKMFIKRIA